MGTERFAWIAQLIHLGELDDLAATQRFLDELRQKQAFLRDVLREALEGIDAAHPDGERTMTVVEFHEWLALHFGLRAVEARIEWCLEADRIIATRMARATVPNRKPKEKP